MRICCVYILTNRSRGALYIGMTANLERRLLEHKHKLLEGFTKDYAIDQLVYYEELPDIYSAIEREKQLKRWHRQWKINLIEATNPDWVDLAPGMVDAEINSA